VDAFESTKTERDNAALASALLLFALAVGSAAVPPPFGAPKLTFFAAMLVYALIVALVPSLRRSSLAWLRVGSLDGRALIAVISISTLSCAGLLLYDRVVHPDLGDLRSQLPRLDAAELLVFGVVLSLVNAISEEVAYRGVLQHALESEFGAGALAVVLQGVAFAAPHYGHGFPRGPFGLVLTGVFGVVLGILRRWAKGLLAPAAAHLVADLTIFGIVSHSTT